MSNEKIKLLYEISQTMTEEQFDFFLFCLKAKVDGTLEMSVEGIEKKHLEYLNEQASVFKDTNGQTWLVEKIDGSDIAHTEPQSPSNTHLLDI